MFAGNQRQIEVTCRNAGKEPARAQVHTRLYQATSATAVSLGESPWKELTILPGQTVLESATLDFPTVKAETQFLVKWVEGTNKVIGTTEVLVYPTNLLSELKTIAGEEPLGVFDPNNQLKPLLKSAAVEFSDLEETGVEVYRGKLVIAGPFQNTKQVPETLAAQLKFLAEKGIAVVWLQPPPDKKSALTPSYYVVAEATVPQGIRVQALGGRAQALSENPQAQLNLIYLSRLALRPEPLRLPFSTPQP